MIATSEIKKQLLKKYPLAKKTHLSWPEFVELATVAAKFYHFPKQIIICQAALETGRGTSYMCLSKNNYFGFMAYDENPDLAKKYQLALDSIIDYLELITKSPRYSLHLKSKDPITIITGIHSSGYATDPDYVKKITSLKEWHE